MSPRSRLVLSRSWAQLGTQRTQPTSTEVNSDLRDAPRGRRRGVFQGDGSTVLRVVATTCGGDPVRIVVPGRRRAVVARKRAPRPAQPQWRRLRSAEPAPAPQLGRCERHGHPWRGLRRARRVQEQKLAQRRRRVRPLHELTGEDGVAGVGTRGILSGHTRGGSPAAEPLGPSRYISNHRICRALDR
jgi:hypothetical protein